MIQNIISLKFYIVFEEKACFLKADVAIKTTKGVGYSLECSVKEGDS